MHGWHQYVAQLSLSSSCGVLLALRGRVQPWHHVVCSQYVNIGLKLPGSFLNTQYRTAWYSYDEMYALGCINSLCRPVEKMYAGNTSLISIATTVVPTKPLQACHWSQNLRINMLYWHPSQRREWTLQYRLTYIIYWYTCFWLETVHFCYS